MLSLLFSQWGITGILVLALSSIGGYLYFKGRSIGAKKTEDAIRMQAQEQKSNADDELAKSNAESASESTSAKFKWLRKYAHIKN